MAFKDIRFPTNISYGAVGGPMYSTDIVTMASGFESRNQNWESSRRSWDVGMAVTSDSDRTSLITFFRIVKGKAHYFRFKDFTDFEVSESEGVFTTLTSSTKQLYKRYTNAAGTEDVKISLPVAATIVIKQGGTTLTSGVHYTLDSATGIVTLLTSPTPAPTAWSGQYDVAARFDTDSLGLTAADLDVFRTQNIPIVEVRV